MLAAIFSDHVYFGTTYRSNIAGQSVIVEAKVRGQ
jgi:hypothetical protein